jgi:ATP-dependent helicase/nuclease subunit B
VVLSLLYSIVEELRHSSFTPIHTEWSTYQTDGSGPSPMVLHLDEADDPSQLVELILGGIIDRVDLYRKDDQIYIRVIDYKSSHHDFSEASLINDMNVQLLLYLFMLCSPQNRALFTGAEDGDGVSVIPASAVYMSPSEDKSDGHIEAMRTGVILNDEEVLQAASPNGPEFLPGVKISKSGQPTGKSLYSAERMSELEIKLQTLIRDTAARLYGGCANRTPSEDACQFCPMRSGCYLAVTSHSF